MIAVQVRDLFSSWGSTHEAQQLITHLALTWEEMAKSGLVPEGRLRKPIADSWFRCLKSGVSPLQRGVPILTATERDLHKLRQENQWLLGAAGTVVAQLSQLVSGTDHVVALSDRFGRLLVVEGDLDTKQRASLHNFVPGSDWSERAAGTNAIGTALYTRQPVHLLAYEHFCMNSHPWCCSAAPIRDPLSGQVLGVLDLTGGAQAFQPHSLGLVITAVKAVEDRLHNALSEPEQHLMHAIWRQGVDDLVEGLVAINADGRIVRINRAAARMLDLREDEALGKRATDVGELGEFLWEVVRRRRERETRVLRVRSEPGAERCRITCTLVEAPGQLAGAVAVIRADDGRPSYSYPRTMGRDMAPRRAAPSVRYTFANLIGKSPAFLRAVELARKAATRDVTVLLCGESGTGKEVFAQAIHAASHRRLGPFVTLNCGAVPRELATSELFGYVEGAFTGARKQGHPGKFEAASGGTLFLDEVSEASPELQVMLLRVLQEREVVRIGSHQPIPVDVRVVAATNSDLERAVAEGRFRLDLYYRLSVVTIRLPSLRERREDIPLLAAHFLERAAQASGTQKRLTEDALDLLYRYGWPGNVRELENLMIRAASLSDGEWITAGDLNLPQDVADRLRASVESTLPEEPRVELLGLTGRRGRPTLTEVEAAVKEVGGNFKLAAQRLGVSRATLYRYLARSGARPDHLRTSRPGQQ